MRKNFLRIGAALMAIAVIMGAFGAHALKEVLDVEKLKTFETAVRYQAYHALAILMVGMLMYFRKTSFTTVAGWLFVAGVAFFPVRFTC
ncbi:MAG: DUF423 domain-containing protein [Saprospiraceae bacterium]